MVQNLSTTMAPWMDLLSEDELHSAWVLCVIRTELQHPGFPSDPTLLSQMIGSLSFHGWILFHFIYVTQFFLKTNFTISVCVGEMQGAGGGGEGRRKRRREDNREGEVGVDHGPQYMCRGQRTSFRSLFYPCMGIKLRSQGLRACAFIAGTFHWPNMYISFVRSHHKH